MMKNQGKELLPLILIYILFNSFFLLGKNWLAKYGIDYLVLIIANLLFFIVSILIYRMKKKAVMNANPNVFVRAIMGGTMIKMAVCVIAIGIYAFAFKSIFSKWSVLAAMFLYLIYLFAESRMAAKLNNKRNA